MGLGSWDPAVSKTDTNPFSCEADLLEGAGIRGVCRMSEGGCVLLPLGLPAPEDVHGPWPRGNQAILE